MAAARCALTIALATFVAASLGLEGEGASESLGGASLTAESSDAAAAEEGVACQSLSFWSHDEVTKKVSGEMALMVKRLGLFAEYKALSQNLMVADTGKLGTWKGSELYRTLYVGGHEAAFKAKGADLYLVREDAAIKLASKFKICIVDREASPMYVPQNVYHDGKNVPIAAFGERLGKIPIPFLPKAVGMLPKTPMTVRKEMPEGVVAQSLEELFVQSEKSTMPVDVLKMLESKGALGLHADYAAQINVGECSGRWGAAVTRDFQDKFEVLGLRLFYNQHPHKYNCGDLVSQLCTKWFTWIEYVDLARPEAASYVPKVGQNKEIVPAYPLKHLLPWMQCKHGGELKLKPSEADEVKEDSFFHPERAPTEGCGQVAGATQREAVATNSTPADWDGKDCKCPGKDHAIFCGNAVITKDRKFEVGAIIGQCAAPRRAYCAPAPCEYSGWRHETPKC